MMTSLTFIAQDESDTQRLGALLADALPNGTVLALNGTLGSGKTRLTQALAEACGVPRQDVVSPTFVLCQEYRGRRTIFHLDAYRIQDDDEFLQLGPEECFESPAITVVEWADRVTDCLPRERLEVRIEVCGESVRSFEITAIGDRLLRVVEKLAVGLKAT